MQSTTEFQHICLIESNKQIEYPGSGNKSTFVYDGFDLNRTILEFNSSSISSTKQFIWDKYDRAEIRNSAGIVISKLFRYGESNSGVNTFYLSDHLASVNALCNSSGNIVEETRYSPFGERYNILFSAAIQYAGLYSHERSKLYVAIFREFDSHAGRFISRDPLDDSYDYNRYLYDQTRQ